MRPPSGGVVHVPLASGPNFIVDDLKINFKEAIISLIHIRYNFLTSKRVSWIISQVQEQINICRCCRLNNNDTFQHTIASKLSHFINFFSEYFAYR